MNKKDLTKPMLESVAKKFNADLIDDDPIVIGRKVTKDELSAEIKKTAKDLLREGDEQFFTGKDFEILTLIGVDLKKCGLIMTVDQGTATEKDDGKDETPKEIIPGEKRSTKKTKDKPKTVTENAGNSKDSKKDKSKNKKSQKKNTTKPKKEKRLNIGKFIMDGISDGTFDNISNDKIIDIVKEKFPGCNTNPKNISWYRRKLKLNKAA